MKKYLRHLGTLAIIGVFCLAIWLLYHKLKAYSMEQIRESIEQISTGRICASFALMILNYMVLVGYDGLALMAIHKKLPLSKISLVSFVGCVISYNFGALLGGSTVRYRFYTTWKFSLVDIVRLVLMLAVTFWVGALGLAGAVFLVAPPAVTLKGLPTDMRPLGAVLLAIALLYLLICHYARKPLHIFGKEFTLPPLRIAIMQAAVAGLDLVIAAACMYVLLPGDLGISFIQFLPSYLMAQVAVVLTHVPGGAGVFELVILNLTDVQYEQVIVAALLCFRVIYFLIPLVFAAILLATHELMLRKNLVQEASAFLSASTHSIIAYTTFAAGSILLVSCILPLNPQKYAQCMDFFPFGLLDLGHFFTALAGMGLLLLSYGIQRRKAQAWYWSARLLAVGIAGCLLKGMDWTEALMTGAILLALCISKPRFYRKSSLFCEPIRKRWYAAIMSLLCLLAGLSWALYGAPFGLNASITDFSPGANDARVLRSFLICGLIFLVFLIKDFSVRKARTRRIKGA